MSLPQPAAIRPCAADFAALGFSAFSSLPALANSFLAFLGLAPSLLATSCCAFANLLVSSFLSFASAQAPISVSAPSSQRTPARPPISVLVQAPAKHMSVVHASSSSQPADVVQL